MKELTPGDLIAGKFRLDRIVGRGGMGSVWAARNEQLGMLVALKFIEAEQGTDLADARARFEREARAAAQIRSPHVAQILDHGLDGDRPYIAMELLEGEDLGERLRREGYLSLPAVARIVTQVSKALRRAHEAGIIHRDLKPGNIFLARFDDDEIVKILDFGVAKVRPTGAIDPADATQTGVVFGSPSYMSPEQARGVRTLDHRSDLWSLAVIVFRAVTGVKPFQASSIGDLVVKLCIDPLPVATSFAPDLPPEIDRFFERAFARDIDKRFASAVDLAAALEAVAARSIAGAAPMVGAQTIGAPMVGAPTVGAQTFSSGPFPSAPLPNARPLPAPPPGMVPGPNVTSPTPLPPMAPPPASMTPAPLPPIAPPPPAPFPPIVPPPAVIAPVSGPPPSVGSGPHVAFASGTLTPPPGSAPPIDPLPPTASPSPAMWSVEPAPDPDALTIVRPRPPEASARIEVQAPAPIVTPPPSTPVVAPHIAPPEHAASLQAAPVQAAPSPPSVASSAPRIDASQRRLVIGAAIGASVLGLLVAVLAVVSLTGSAGGVAPAAHPAVSAAAIESVSERRTDPVPPSSTASASAAPSVASAEPSAEPSATAEPASSGVAADGAEPDPSAKSGAGQRLPTKPGKKRPNFGY
ncbi:Adenylate cyclase [Minicystis rosea]|nr:Adenylate cyclase [Minicystis rosea]